MKIFSILFLLFSFNQCYSQTIGYQIDGKIKSTNPPKYAYLVNLGSGEFLFKTTIVDGVFQLKVSIDSKGESYRSGIFFLDNRDNFTLAEIKSKLDNRIWRVSHDANLIVLALENITIEIDSPSNIKNALLLPRASLTVQLREQNEAFKSRNFLPYIKKYPDSPISLQLLHSVMKYYKLSVDRSESAYGHPPTIFNALSERLKNSKEGIEVKKLIDEVYEP